MSLFAGFTDEKEISGGSSSILWQAYQPALSRRVAIKVLRPTASLERFRAEARLIASLEDDHIVRVFDYVEADSATYFVQEWIDGETLESLLDRHGALTPEQSLAVCRGALQGLAYAHSRGLVHADIAPGNVMVDLQGTSKLIDFGLAAPTGTPGAFGTPAFMSPEAVMGHRLVPASDVYSTAAMLFLLLEGRPPMPGPSLAETMRQHQEAAPPALHGKPAALSALLARAMAKDPATRPQDAAQFLAELEEAAREGYGAGWIARGSVAALVTAGVASGGMAGARELATSATRPSPASEAAPPVVTAEVSTGAASSGKPPARPAKSRRFGPRTLAIGALAAAAAAVIVVISVAGGSSHPVATTDVVTTSGAPSASAPAPAVSASASPDASRTPEAGAVPQQISGTYRVTTTVISASGVFASQAGATRSFQAVLPASCNTGKCQAKVNAAARGTFTVTFDGRRLVVTYNTSGPCPGTDVQDLTVVRRVEGASGEPAVLSGTQRITGPCSTPGTLVSRNVYTRVQG